MRLPSVVLGMPRKALVCKCDLFSSLSGNLPQKDFQRRAEAMHARWADIRARPTPVPLRGVHCAATEPIGRARMQRLKDAIIWASAASRAPGGARAAQTRGRQTSALLDR